MSPAHTSPSSITPLQIAIRALLDSPSCTPPHAVRELILALDVTIASFGVGLNDRDSVTCADADLPRELANTAVPLADIPAEMQNLLLEDIEDLLARHAPRAFVLYAARRKLWGDANGWKRTTGILVTHVHDAETRQKLTAVLADHLFPEVVAP